MMEVSPTAKSLVEDCMVRTLGEMRRWGETGARHLHEKPLMNAAHERHD